MNFEHIVYKNKDEIVKTLQELLRIPSVLDFSTATKEMPFGKNINDALEYMLNLGKKDGFDIINDEGYAGEITYKGATENSVGILCHLDVVPEGNNWTYPPYEARIVDDKIYARGTEDDKGPTIACYYALKFIKPPRLNKSVKAKFYKGLEKEIKPHKGDRPELEVTYIANNGTIEVKDPQYLVVDEGNGVIKATATAQTDVDNLNNVEIIGGTPITVKRATKEECLAAHPGGISSADFGNEHNLNYY